jgi:hypothetical protein
MRERVSASKADQKARSRYLGGKVPFGLRRGDGGSLTSREGEQEGVREIVALRAQGRPLRATADTVRAKGYQISHEGVAGVLRPARRAKPMPRAGALTLSDVRGPTLGIVCEPCGRRGRLSVAKPMEEHGDAKLTDLLQTARRLPEGALRQHP